MHVFVEFVRGRFVEDDGVVCLVLDCGRATKLVLNNPTVKRKEWEWIWGKTQEWDAIEHGGEEKVHTFAFRPLLLLLLACGGCCGCLCTCQRGRWFYARLERS